MIQGAWLPLPGRFIAVAVGSFVFVRAGVTVTPRLLGHELVHVVQWRRMGLSFPFRYVWAWVSAGFSYWDNEFEVEARERAEEFQPEAERLIAGLD